MDPHNELYEEGERIKREEVDEDEGDRPFFAYQTGLSNYERDRRQREQEAEKQKEKETENQK